MAAGYKFTSGDNGAESQYYESDGTTPRANSYDVIRGVTRFGIDNDGKIEIWIGNSLAIPAFLPSAVLAIDGVAPDADSTAKEIIQLLSPVFPKASTTGGGGGGVTAMAASEWSGLESLIMTGNVDLTIGTASTGVLLLTNPASHTFKVYGTSVVIRNSGSNGGRTTVTYAVHPNGKLWVESDADSLPIEITIPAPDVTAPTILSVEATDANTIVITFDENVNGTDAGFAFDNGAALTINGVTGDGTDTWTFDINETMTDADTITYDYVAASGDAEDDSGNVLADDSGSVTNSIAAANLTWPFKTNVSEANGGVYKSAGANGYNDFARSGQSFGVGDKLVWRDGNAAVTGVEWAVGFGTNASPSSLTVDFIFSLYQTGGSIYKLESGATASIGTSHIGDYYRVNYFNSTTIKYEQSSDGISWSTLATSGVTPSGTYYAIFSADKVNSAIINVSKA